MIPDFGVPSMDIPMAGWSKYQVAELVHDLVQNLSDWLAEFQVGPLTVNQESAKM